MVRATCWLISIGVISGSLLSPVRAEPKSVADHVDLVFLAPRHPVFIRLHLHVDGTGVFVLRQRFADQLFRSLDRDGDKRLSDAEARRIPSLGDTDGQASELEDGWKTWDRIEPDGTLSLDELSLYVERTVGSPVAIERAVDRPVRVVELFNKIDRDSNGRLTDNELGRSESSLSKYDLDEDGTFAITELDPLASVRSRFGAEEESQDGLPILEIDGSESRKTLFNRYDHDPHDSRLSAKELGVPADSIAEFDENKDGGLQEQELANYVKELPDRVNLEARLPHLKRARAQIAERGAKPALRKTRLGFVWGGVPVEWRSRAKRSAAFDTRRFYRQQFIIADRDKNRYLDEEEFPASQLQAPFDRVDRDGNGQVTVEELVQHVDSDNAFAQSRVTITVSTTGKSLFEILDADLDRRIGPVELRTAHARLQEFDADKDNEIAGAELAGRYRITVEIGRPALFQQSTMAMARRGQGTDPILRESSGPAWFQKMDRNQDAQVSRREFLGPLAAFDAMDEDSDGLLTLAEVETPDEDEDASEPEVGDQPTDSKK